VGRAFRQTDGNDIELVAPNPTAFGGPADDAGWSRAADLGRHTTPPVDDAPRQRWATAVAAVAVIAFIAGGVIAASPWDATPSAAPATTVVSTAPSTTLVERVHVGGTSTAAVSFGDVDPNNTHGLRLDPIPEGFLALGTQSVIGTEPASADDAADGWGEVWATEGATRTTGRWVSLTILRSAMSAPGGAAERIVIDGRAGFLSGDADGVIRLTLDMSDGLTPRSLTISSHGRTGADLIEFAASLSITADASDPPANPPADRIGYSRPELLAGYNLVELGRTSGDLVDELMIPAMSRSSTWYRSTTHGDIIDVTMLRDAPRSRALRQLTVTPLDDLLADVRARCAGGEEDPQYHGLCDAVPPGFDGEQLELGYRAIDQQMLTIVRWNDSGEPMAMITTLDPHAALELLRTVRRSNAAEWSSVAESVSANRMLAPGHIGLPEPIASDTFTDGITWAASAWPDDDVYRVEIGSLAGESRFVPYGAAALAIDSRADGTVVVARHEAGTMSTLRVVTSAGTRDRPLVGASDSPNHPTFAAIGFDTSGAFMAQVIRNDTGAVIASYVSPTFGSNEG
jgi:hypothetical protein